MQRMIEALIRAHPVGLRADEYEDAIEQALQEVVWARCSRVMRLDMEA